MGCVAPMCIITFLPDIIMGVASMIPADLALPVPFGTASASQRETRDEMHSSGRRGDIGTLGGTF